jgi:integrase
MSTQKATVVNLAETLDRYVEQDRTAIGRTKAQVLEAIKRFEIADKDITDIRSEDLVDFTSELGRKRKPQTVQNYLSHLSAVFSVARSAWGVPVSREVMQDALDACKRLGLTAKSAKRSRRPTLDELNRLYYHFKDRQGLPMHHVLVFAVFSTRRQEEITRIRWDDLEADRILVRDMKNPGAKIGNDVWCDLPPEARRVIEQMPPTHPEIFPFKSISISAAFTRACKLLGIGVGGASVTQVAQRHEIRRQQIYAWRHDLKKKGLWSPDAGALFYPVDIPVTAGVPQLHVPEAPPPTAVELRLRGGRCLHFNSMMDPAALTALIRAVEIG